MNATVLTPSEVTALGSTTVLAKIVYAILLLEVELMPPSRRIELDRDWSTASTPIKYVIGNTTV